MLWLVLVRTDHGVIRAKALEGPARIRHIAVLKNCKVTLTWPRSVVREVGGNVNVLVAHRVCATIWLKSAAGRTGIVTQIDR
jgi:hypothetical protein